MRIECDRCLRSPLAAENRHPVCSQIADHGPRCWVSPSTATRARMIYETIGTVSLPRFPCAERTNSSDPLVPGSDGVYHRRLWWQSLCYSDLPECLCSREQAGVTIVPG